MKPKKMSYNEWWENYLKIIIDYKTAEFKTNAQAEFEVKVEAKPLPGSDLVEKNHEYWFKSPFPETCEGCHENFRYAELDGNMLCEECSKKASTNETGIKMGNQEAAFFFANQDLTAPEVRIVKSVNYLECPGAGKHGMDFCRFEISHLEKMKPKPKIPLHRMLFDHYREKHYLLVEKEHSDFQNMAYAILQEFAIYEANKGPSRGTKINTMKHNKRALALHNLIKHLGVPLNILAFTLRQNQGHVGDLAFDGMLLCTVCGVDKKE